jgi:RNA ligase (TIGR02306 family)
MSTLKIQPVRIEEVLPHPDPETTGLDLIPVGGWCVLVKKGSFVVGDTAIYFPIDSLLPLELSDAIGVTKYLGTGGHVKAAKLRGVPSYGVLWHVHNAMVYAAKIHMDILKVNPMDTKHTLPRFVVDEDLTEYLGVTKWEPPVKLHDGDEEKHHTLFDKYTDIENYRNYTRVFSENEDIVVTEKIHGSTAQYGLISEDDQEIYMAGSHNIRLKDCQNSKIWTMFSQSLKDMLKHIKRKYNAHAVIAYGELYGLGIQDLTYGMKGISIRLFDIKVDDRYLDYEDFVTFTGIHNISVAPSLYRGPFSLEKIKSFEGKSWIGDSIIEGVVFKPEKERIHPRIGRTILKYVYDSYYNRKGNKTEYH